MKRQHKEDRIIQLGKDSQKPIACFAAAALYTF